MEQNDQDHISLSSLTSRNDKQLKPSNHNLFTDQANLSGSFISKNTLRPFNSPSVVLSEFDPSESDPNIKGRPLSSSLSRISPSPCSFHRRLAFSLLQEFFLNVLRTLNVAY
uniref:Uncharacterized protein n=1 Tax=Setaria digitata TaxID=48799 RepID=A0A915PP22_9BILA